MIVPSPLTIKAEDFGDSSCECVPQWSGAQCASFNFVPTPKGAGYQPTTLPAAAGEVPGVPPHHWTQQVSSWGGMVLYDQSDEQYHGFFSTFTEGCNVWAWASNSIVTHAVSRTPLGPFTLSTLGAPDAVGCAMHTW